jgi:type IV pilus assembly protein PilQ
LFRSTSNQNQRQEVVIVVTPQLVDENSRFGYNFTPGNETSDILKKQGFPIQGNPTP